MNINEPIQKGIYQNYIDDIIDKTRNETAEEIFAKVLEWSPIGEDYHWFITTLENWLKEHYGVEVEE